MFAKENTAPCKPAGMPMRIIRRNTERCMRSFFGSTLIILSLRISFRRSIAELKRFEMTVAVATPLTVIFSTITKKRFSATFSSPEKNSAISGERVSPTLRNIAASKL